jgi:hypothetical protein
VPLDHVQFVRLAIGAYNQEWRALGEGAALWADFIDPEVVWEENEPAFTGLEREYRGHEGLARWFKEVLEPWDFSAVEERRLEEFGDSVVVQIRLQGRGRESGADVDMTVCNVFTFRDGKVVRRRLFYEWDDAVRAASSA